MFDMFGHCKTNVGRDSRNDSIFQHSDLVLYRMHTVCGVLVSKHARSDVNLQEKIRALLVTVHTQIT